MHFLMENDFIVRRNQNINITAFIFYYYLKHNVVLETLTQFFLWLHNK